MGGVVVSLRREMNHDGTREVWENSRQAQREGTRGRRKATGEKFVVGNVLSRDGHLKACHPRLGATSISASSRLLMSKVATTLSQARIAIR